jgi:hypothetical protein
MAQSASMAMEDAAVQSRGFRGASGNGAPCDEGYSGGQGRNLMRRRRRPAITIIGVLRETPTGGALGVPWLEVKAEQPDCL